MIVVPAIDLRGGKCVRLKHGDVANETVYSDDPVAIARTFVEAGTKRIHVVDLDGAQSGRPMNVSTIADICSATTIPVEVGGGIRTEEDIQKLFEIGVARVIIG